MVHVIIQVWHLFGQSPIPTLVTSSPPDEFLNIEQPGRIHQKGQCPQSHSLLWLKICLESTDGSDGKSFTPESSRGLKRVGVLVAVLNVPQFHLLIKGI